uniref:Uncharacterized protein n=1 Tax=Sphaerodactylus townsendi TaxID=933632 RepID=A0ACB8G8L2_9SAUR
MVLSDQRQEGKKSRSENPRSWIIRSSPCSFTPPFPQKSPVSHFPRLDWAVAWLSLKGFGSKSKSSVWGGGCGGKQGETGGSSFPNFYPVGAAEHHVSRFPSCLCFTLKFFKRLLELPPGGAGRASG